jgi:hypothetical protein
VYSVVIALEAGTAQIAEHIWNKPSIFRMNHYPRVALHSKNLIPAWFGAFRVFGGSNLSREPRNNRKAQTKTRNRKVPISEDAAVTNAADRGMQTAKMLETKPIFYL